MALGLSDGLTHLQLCPVPPRKILITEKDETRSSVHRSPHPHAMYVLLVWVLRRLIVLCLW